MFGILGGGRCWRAGSLPHRFALRVCVLESHFFQFAAPVEFVMPGVGLLTQVLHIDTNEHLPQLHKITVLLVFHWKTKESLKGGSLWPNKQKLKAQQSICYNWSHFSGGSLETNTFLHRYLGQRPTDTGGPSPSCCQRRPPLCCPLQQTVTGPKRRIEIGIIIKNWFFCNIKFKVFVQVWKTYIKEKKCDIMHRLKCYNLN